MLIKLDDAIAAILAAGYEGSQGEAIVGIGDAVSALRAIPTVSVTTRCGTCHYCLMQNWDGKGFPPTAIRMVLCTDCGNKRCPKAANCGNVCTGSNEPGQTATVSDGWEDRLPPHKASLSITHNQHKDYYQTVAQLIAEQEDYYSPDSFPEGEREKCIALDEIWTVHWYPETPVGFNLVHASTLQAALGPLPAPPSE